MRDKLLIVAIVLPALLGCGLGDRLQKAVEDSGTNTNANSNTAILTTNSNKSLTEKAVDTAVGESKIGIAECDEAMDVLSTQANDPDDNFVTKAVKKTALNTFRDQLKKNLEENKADKTEVAKFCREFRDNLADSATNSNANTGGSF